MKKRIIALLLAVIAIIHICIPALPVIAQGSDSADGDTSVIGAHVRFNTTDSLIYVHKNVTNSGPSYDAERISPTVLPDTYVVLDEITVSYGTQFYKLGTIDGSPNDILDNYPWVKAILMEIVPDPDADLIKGQVDLTDGSDKLGELAVKPGEKEYVFTDLGEQISTNATYRWQLLVDKADSRWADIIDYCYPYAVVTEALILNARDESGIATMRCIVTDGDKKYVSNNIKVSLEKPKALLSEAVASSEIGANARLARNFLDSSSKAALNAFHIVIEYVYLHENAVDPLLNGSTAANALTITLPPGAAFNNPITSPPLAGYKPYIEWQSGASEAGLITYGGKQLIPADKVEFNEQKEAVTVTVYYVPQIVSYRVKYLKQNLQNDEYVEWKTEFKTGIADTAIAGDLAISEIGFSPLYYEKSTPITNDGDTVVEIYYDRIYYLVEYEIGKEAYGVTPNYVRYGTSLMLGNPTNPGYSFNGWKLTSVKDTKDGPELLTPANLTTTYQNYNVTAANSLITVAHNLVYTAQWTVGTASYTIIFWAENANDNGYSIWTTQTVTGAQSGSTINVANTRIPNTVADRNYFTYNEALSDKSVTVKGDGTAAANIYYTRNIYHLVFTSGSNSTCRIQLHTHGTDCCSVAGCDHTGGTCHLTANCTIGVHIHSDSCGKALTCSVEEHSQHTDACCSKEAHTVHTTSCYGNVGAANTNSQNTNSGDGWGGSTAPTNPIDGQIYQREDGWFGSGGDYDKVIYIGGTWYIYNGSESSGDVKLPACHNHGDGTCDCTKPLHTHKDECYQYLCGKEEHFHVSDSCMRYEHKTHSGCDRYLYVISAKYNADIAEDWPTATEVEEWKALGWLNTTQYYQNWNPDHSSTNWVTKRVDMINELCNTATSRTYTLALTLGRDEGENRVVYMFESVDQTPGPGKVLRNGIYYEENTRYTQEGIASTSLDGKVIVGMTNVVEDSLTLYYTRNSYKLTFVNGGVAEKSANIKYEDPLASQYYVPTIPSSYEKNSVVFAGWYTTQMCADGTEFDFSKGIMPAGELYLYAKWEPTSWDIEVYLDVEKTIPLYSATLPFGSKIPEPDYKKEQAARPSYKDLIWAGWYYTDAMGNEVRFDFNTMVLKTNYDGSVDPDTDEQYPSAIYAKWTSEIPIAYTVYYVTEDANGDYVNVADPTEGVALAGINKSFIAKAGENLYPEYRDYIPLKRSISHKMSIIADENAIYFEYITTHDIEYTVKHVFQSSQFTEILGTDTFELSWSYTIMTSASDFSGRFVISFDADLYNHVLAHPNGSALWNIIEDLSPDAYKQELILTTDESNEVVFYWQDHSEVFIYQVIHYFQRLDYKDLPADDQYTAEYYQEFVGAYAEQNSVTVHATPIERQGFTLNSSKSVLSMILNKSDDGIKERVLEVYYDRDTISYTVQHIYGGNVDTVNKTALYEEVVTEVARTDILGYVIADTDKAEQSVSITYDGQMINFYYVAQQVIFNYQVIGNLGGYISNPQETVSIGTPAAGSEPEAMAGYIFIGWYTDEDATTKVLDSWVDSSGKLTPVASVADANKMITFYAKFAPNSLTIRNSFTSYTQNPNPALDVIEHGFIYNIRGVDGTATQGVHIRVAVLSGASQTILALPVGDYVVTVESEWSWRYTSINEVLVTMADGTNSQDAAISSATWTLIFTGSGEMQVTYDLPGADVPGGADGDDYYYVTDNAVSETN